MKLPLLLKAVAFIGLSAGACFADVKVPALISDHMVLQKSDRVPIWGKADPGEEVAVTLDKQTVKTRTGEDGKWRATLDLKDSGPGPFQLVIAGKNKLTIADVVVGEVWLDSGQSNMALQLLRLPGLETDKEVAKTNPMLRLFFVRAVASLDPLDDCGGKWLTASPDTTGHFGAVAYYFGNKLQSELKVPVGLIHSAWGNTASEAWTSSEALDTVPDLKSVKESQLAAAKAQKDKAEANPSAEKAPALQKVASCLFNGMVKPLTPCAIAGVIWYQGENNVPRAWQYRTAFPLLIKDWRAHWGRGDLPFYFCQLANCRAKLPQPGESRWAELREAQSSALSLPKTGQAVLIDIGEVGIHPKNKKDVGERLALIALANNYGKQVVFSGPVYESMKPDDSMHAFRQIRLTFKHADGGLAARPLPETGETTPRTDRTSPKSELEGFAICGADHKWVWADAMIDGNTVLVGSSKVSNPVAVRYGWADNPTCNLYNGAGLPASPFRTDDFPAVTRDAKYGDTKAKVESE